MSILLSLLKVQVKTLVLTSWKRATNRLKPQGQNKNARKNTKQELKNQRLGLTEQSQLPAAAQDWRSDDVKQETRDIPELLQKNTTVRLIGIREEELHLYARNCNRTYFLGF